jgi:hypothetical protein
MKLPKSVSRIGSAVVVGALLALTLPSGAQAAAGRDGDAVVVAQAGGTEPRDLEPRYKPIPPEPEPDYNSSYIFALTRGVADSTMHAAAKVPLFLLTVPLDLAFLPIAAIGGFF